MRSPPFAFMLSLFVHSPVMFLFWISGNTPAQYGVTAAPQSIELSVMLGALLPGSTQIPCALAPQKEMPIDTEAPKPKVFQAEPKPIISTSVKMAQTPTRFMAVSGEKRLESVPSQKVGSGGMDALNEMGSVGATGAVSASGTGNQPPQYPTLARKLGYQGIVLLKVTVDVTGKPATVEVKKTSMYAVLDEAARKAVQKWRFHPARKFGNPVASAVTIPIRFKLDES